MNQKFFSNSQIKLALSLDGFEYSKNNPDFNLKDILEKYWSNNSWNHVSQIEAKATLFLIFKAIKAWQNSSYPISEEELTKYYGAFYSLYGWITDPKNKKVIVHSHNYRNFRVKFVDTNLSA